MIGRSIRTVSGIVLALLVTACATTATRPPDSTSFEAYRDATVALKDQSNAALDTEYQVTYANEIEEIESAERIDPTMLLLDFPGIYTWTYPDNDQFVFVEIARSRAKLAALNQLMVDYANQLMILVGANPEDGVDLEKVATDFQASAGSIANTLGVNVSSNDLALFSVLATAGARVYIESQRREDLAEVLKAAQPVVDKFINSGRQAMQISAAGIKAEYQTDSLALARALATADNGRADALEKLLALNKRTSTQLELLAAIDKGYAGLSQAHLQLAASVMGNQPLGFQDLVSQTRNMQALYERLKNLDAG